MENLKIKYYDIKENNLQIEHYDLFNKDFGLNILTKVFSFSNTGRSLGISCK